MADIDDVYSLCETISSNLDAVGAIQGDMLNDLGTILANVTQLQQDGATNISPIGGGQLTEQLLDSGVASGDYDNLPQLYWGVVELSQIPTNASFQSGGIAPNVVYAGWFGFKSGGYYLPREPVHFAKSGFRAPAGADGCYFTLYNGFLGNIIGYVFGGGPED